LTAIIKAQALAAQTTVDFMRKVGLTTDNKVINAQFYYNITNATTGERKLHKLSVPLLTIIPIPYVRVRARNVPPHILPCSHTPTISLYIYRCKSPRLSSTPN
jgi:Protein of unknown function (DUF2589)